VGAPSTRHHQRLTSDDIYERWPRGRDVLPGAILIGRYARCVRRNTDCVAVALISFTAVRIVGVALLVAGVLAIANSHRLRRGSAVMSGIGALGATVGVVSLYRSFDSHIDGPAGWQEMRWIFASPFDSWVWVAVFAAVATTAWLGVAVTVSRRWSGLRALAVLTGTVVGSVTLGLLDRSL